MIIGLLFVAIHTIYMFIYPATMKELDERIAKLYNSLQSLSASKGLERPCEAYYGKSTEYFKNLIYLWILINPSDSWLIEILWYPVSLHILIVFVYSLEIYSFILLMIENSCVDKNTKIRYYEKTYNYRKTYENTLLNLVEYLYEYVGNIVFDWDETQDITLEDSVSKSNVADAGSQTIADATGSIPDFPNTTNSQLYPPPNGQPPQLYPPPKPTDSDSNASETDESITKKKRRSFMSRTTKRIL